MSAKKLAPGCETLAARLQMSLDRFDLDVDFETSGRVTGIFGSSGSGKTSLLEAVAGIRRARGVVRLGPEAWLDSARGHHVAAEERSVGYVPQDGLLFPHLNVRANLLSGARRAERAGHDVASTLALVSRTLGIEPLLTRMSTTLSGGEKQRVALGRALCSAPRLLLLDEPFASLDIPLRRRLLPFLDRVREQFQIPMLLVSHDPAEVQAICDEVIVLERGRVKARGEPRTVLALEAGVEDFDNVLPCKVVGMSDEAGRVELSDGTVLATRPADARVGDTTFVTIGARDVIVATSEPHGLSARNVLPGVVQKVQDAGVRRLLEVRVNQEDLVLELSRAACEELGLVAGKYVHLVIKSSSCVLYPAAKSQTSDVEQPDAT